MNLGRNRQRARARFLGGSSALVWNITMPADVWAFGASSMAGTQTPVTGVQGPEDSWTNVVRAVNSLPAGSLAYSPSGAAQLTRPIDYVLTGASAGKFIRNRGVGGLTAGPAGGVFTTMDAAKAGFGASDFVALHQGDNGVTITNVGANENIILAGFTAMRGLLTTQTFVQIVNTQGGYNFVIPQNSPEPPGGAWGYAKAVQLRVLNDINPGRAFSFYETVLDRATGLDANDLADRALGLMMRSYMMNDGSHQIAKGYNLQSDAVMTPLIDAWAGGTPFPLKQIVETVAPATPAPGDSVGSIVAYGSGGTFALDSSNTQTDYAVSSSGAITRIGATLPARDITWAAVKTTKAAGNDKVQPLIGICERAAPGVSRMVEFDGASVIGASDSKLANAVKMTFLMRLKSTDTSVNQNVFGAQLGTTQCLVRILTTSSGVVDVTWRNAAGTTIYSDTTAANLFRTSDPARWLAVCIDLTGPAVGINKMVTWVDPASPSATRVRDTAAADVVRLNLPLAFGAVNANLSQGGSISKFQAGDFTLFNDYIDFSILANRQEVSNTDGTPKAAWVLGGGVTAGITPLIYMGGNAGDWRMGRIRGSAIPASPGASGQYFGFNNRERSPGVPGFLVTV